MSRLVALVTMVLPGQGDLPPKFELNMVWESFSEVQIAQFYPGE
jgi:hypothetical protein